MFQGGDNIKNNKKKVILGTGALTLMILSYFYKHDYKPNFTIIDDPNGPYASYSNGFVYIGDKEFLDSLENIELTDVLVLDERFQEDPNMAIYNSYVISNKEYRNEILEILCCYENEYPSNWNRTIESMRCEWFIHNVSCYFNYKVDHSSEVDLNNEDQDKYNQKVLSRIFKI